MEKITKSQLKEMTKECVKQEIVNLLNESFSDWVNQQKAQTQRVQPTQKSKTSKKTKN